MTIQRRLSVLALVWAFLACPLSRAATNGVVVALGKLRPREGLMRIAAPFSLQGPSLISELRVGVGDTVESGQVLARTHVYPSAAAALAQAEAEVAVYQARLAVVKSGLKPSEIAALAAETEHQRTELSEAGLLLARARRLRAETTISQQEWENAQARWESASNRVQAASQRLAAGEEVREVDVALARAEVGAAQARMERVRRELEQTEIRAPFAGEVIAIHARPGEIASQGLLDLGRTREMEVLAEVYESDVRHIKVSQQAEVLGDAFAGGLRAQVIEVGRQVRPNRLLHPDPAAFADNRVVEVVLKMEDSTTVAGLTGALVNVRFLP